MKVLIAEDDAFLQKIYRKHLEDRGHEVLCATNGEEAIALAGESPYIIVLDVVMPGRDGLDVLQQIKEQPALSSIPVVVITNLNQEADEKRAKELGAVEYVKKSTIKIESLDAILRKHMTS